MLKCPKCNTINQDNSKFCHQCGAILRAHFWHKAKKITLLACAAVVGTGVFYGYKVFMSPMSEKKSDPQIVPSIFSTKEPKSIELLLGLVIIRNITGEQIIRMPVPVVNDGWIALPIRLCLGGYNWKLRMGRKDELSIEGGILSDQDTIGLWRIQENEYLNGTELYPWAEDEPLKWVSLKSQKVFKSVKLVQYRQRGFFVQSLLPNEFPEPGVFIQDNRVVGWTFGSLAEGGYLWRGDKGKNLTPQIKVDDFYKRTFANGREEVFIIALAMDDHNDLERLQGFANGFRVKPKFSIQNTPSHLRTSSIIQIMRSLIAKLVSEGFAQEVADILDRQILIEVDNASLLLDVIRATLESYGYEYAIRLIEEVRQYMVLLDDYEILQLNKLHVQMYQDWSVALLENGSIEKVWEVLQRGGEYFPEDPEIHLLGVKLALANGDWINAERLLYMREYPHSLIDSVKNMENRIAELKAKEGKIVIRFEPGSNQVVVDAILNRDVHQKFIVDTGASMVTIPNSILKDLGISVNAQTPLRQIYTAGGIKMAREVVISSLELEGQAINDIKALVVDLPSQPDVGLLGLNYLNRFRMNLNTEEGIFTLEPRYQ
jgi:clan AA aspartic protease (TIGR02281 family)